MAYDIQNPPSLITQGIGGGVALRRFEWVGTDTVDAVTAPGYVENAEALGIQLGDIVLYKALDGDTFTAHALIVDDVDPDGRVTLGPVDPFSVKGPSDATENNFAVFDGEKGNLIKDAGVGASDFATAEQGEKADLAGITRAQAMAKAIPAGVTSIQTNGYASAGDGGAALYKRVGGEPAHGLKFQSADGAWWEIAEDLITPQMAGAKGISGTDDSPAFMRAVVAAAALRKYVAVTSDVYCSGQIRCPAHTHVVGGGGTIYSQRNNGYYLGGLFVSDNSTIGGTGAPETFDISFKGLRIRDLMPAPNDCTFFGIVCCDGFLFEDNDIVKTSNLWTTYFSVKNASITGNKIDSTQAVLYCDCIHVLEGENIVVSDNILHGQDDALAFYSHSYAESAYGNCIRNVTVTNNVLRATHANSLRLGHSGETYLPNSAAFYIENLVASGNIMTSGVVLVDYRLTVTKFHTSIIIDGNTIDERISLPSNVVAYGDLTIRNNRIRALNNASLYNTNAISITGLAIKRLVVSGNILNWDNASSDNNVVMKASEFIEFTGNTVKVNAAGNGAMLTAPKSKAKNNTLEITAGYRGLWISNGAGRVARTSVAGNEISGTVNFGVEITNCDYAVVDGNDISTAAPYAMSSVTAGTGRLSGVGAPSAVVPNSFEWFRTDGAAATTRYLRQAGAWAAM